ncbi:MAG: hypothetical protein KGJ90_05160 [Patescibacteria group bacterium]|nr:hypothetical protein [Patescibacteria group bacterium]
MGGKGSGNPNPPNNLPPPERHIGNTYCEIFDTTEKRKAVWKKFMLHLERGKSEASFPFALEKVMERLMKVYPQECPPDEYLLSKQKGLDFWEELGREGSAGTVKGFNAHSWKFVMMNKMRWKENHAHADDADRPIGVAAAKALSEPQRAALEHLERRLKTKIEKDKNKT